MKSKTQKKAESDASELARASMFFGEGAGTRRKLIKSSIEQRLKDDPNGYGVAFYRAIDREDMAEHAKEARKERKKIDRHESISRNSRAILTGDHTKAKSNLVLLTMVAVAAHKTGLDVVVYEKSKDVARTTVGFYKRIGQKVAEKQRERRRQQSKINPVD